MNPIARALIVFSALLSIDIAAAETLSTAERKAILDTVRPIASQLANQPVRIKVERMNVDKQWAVLVGELVSPSGPGLDWNKVPRCHPDLDKMLWVVLARTDQWRIAQIDICASEPPFWGEALDHGFLWPCGVYAGLEAPGIGSIERMCRKEEKRARQ